MRDYRDASVQTALFTNDFPSKSFWNSSCWWLSPYSIVNEISAPLCKAVKCELLRQGREGSSCLIMIELGYGDPWIVKFTCLNSKVKRLCIFTIRELKADSFTARLIFHHGYGVFCPRTTHGYASPYVNIFAPLFFQSANKGTWTGMCGTKHSIWSDCELMILANNQGYIIQQGISLWK